MKTKFGHLAIIAICLAISLSATAGTNVFANHQEVSVKTSNGTVMVFPDVCKTPVTAGPIPIPYPSIAMSSEATATGSKNIKTSDQQTAVKGSQISTSSGDEGGQRTGIVSSNFESNIDTAFYALAVQDGGELRIRQYDQRSSASSGTSRSTTSVTEATFVDKTGKKIRLQEPTLIELTNGEYCAVCVSKGKVTKVFRVIEVAPIKRPNRAPQKN